MTDYKMTPPGEDETVLVKPKRTYTRRAKTPAPVVEAPPPPPPPPPSAPVGRRLSRTALERTMGRRVLAIRNAPKP